MNDASQKESRATLAALWFGLAAPPLAWFIHLNVSYVVGSYLCEVDATWALHVATLLALALSAAGVVVSWRRWRATSGRVDMEAGNSLARSRFMAIGGFVMGVLFTFTIALAGVVNFFLDPCGAG